MSVGVRGARFGVDATGRPYVHAGRGGLYYRRRWLAATAAPEENAVPPDPPPPDTHGRLGCGWMLLVLLLGFLLGHVLLRVWR